MTMPTSGAAFRKGTTAGVKVKAMGVVNPRTAKITLGKDLDKILATLTFDDNGAPVKPPAMDKNEWATIMAKLAETGASPGELRPINAQNPVMPAVLPSTMGRPAAEGVGAIGEIGAQEGGGGGAPAPVQDTQALADEFQNVAGSVSGTVAPGLRARNPDGTMPTTAPTGTGDNTMWDAGYWQLKPETIEKASKLSMMGQFGVFMGSTVDPKVYKDDAAVRNLFDPERVLEGTSLVDKGERVGVTVTPLSRESYTKTALELIGLAKTNATTVDALVSNAGHADSPLKWSNAETYAFLQSAKTFGMPIPPTGAKDNFAVDPAAKVDFYKEANAVYDKLANSPTKYEFDFKGVKPINPSLAGRDTLTTPRDETQTPLEVDVRNAYASIMANAGIAAPDDLQMGELAVKLATAQAMAKDMNDKGYRTPNSSMFLDPSVKLKLDTLDPGRKDVIQKIANAVSGKINTSVTNDPAFAASFGQNFRDNYATEVAKDAVRRTFGNAAVTTTAGMMFADIVKQNAFLELGVKAGTKDWHSATNLEDYVSSMDNAGTGLIKSLAAIATNGSAWTTYIDKNVNRGPGVGTYPAAKPIAPGSSVPKISPADTPFGPVPNAEAAGYGNPEMEYIQLNDGNYNGLIAFLNSNLILYGSEAVTPVNAQSVQAAIKEYTSNRFQQNDRIIQSAGNYLQTVDNTDGKLYRSYRETGNDVRADAILVEQASKWGAFPGMPVTAETTAGAKEAVDNVNNIRFYHLARPSELTGVGTTASKSLPWAMIGAGKSRNRPGESIASGGTGQTPEQLRLEEDKRAWIEDLRKRVRYVMGGTRYVGARIR